MTISYRRLRPADFARLAGWQASPHIARWWSDAADLASITDEYAPVVDGRDPTEVFVIELDGQPVGMIQRYLLADYPAWSAALKLTDGVGIDYYLGEERLTGRGLGSQAIRAFAHDTLIRYPEATMVVAAPQQANVASWRALEKAGFERVWAGELDSDDPSDAGPAYVYVRRRESRPLPAEATPRTGRWRHPNHRELASLPIELRRPTIPAHVRDWVARQTDATILRTRRLAGASSTAVHGVYLSDGRRVVLRRYVWPGFLQTEPLAPRRELDALQFAATHGLPVPNVVAADVTGEDVGDGIPVLLMTFVVGRAVASPAPEQLAETLAAIHDTDPSGFAHDYFPWYQETTTEPPPASTQPALWEAAIDLWHNNVPSFRPTFIHRDFHPGNVMWARDRLSGVVDWANACRGPRGCDVATCRGNLVDLAGAAVADRFVFAYETVTGETLDPFWLMAGILEGDPSTWTARGLAEQEPYLERAVRMVSTASPGPSAKRR